MNADKRRSDEVNLMNSARPAIVIGVATMYARAQDVPAFEVATVKPKPSGSARAYPGVRS